MKKNSRNLNVEKATDSIINAVDLYIAGSPFYKIPATVTRDRLQAYFDSNGGSVRLASLFFLSYSIEDPEWDKKSIPIGTRGKYGDKKLSAELTSRHVTFHKNITAFGENLGTKGNVKNFDISTDPRFAGFIGFLELPILGKKELFNYICILVAESRIVPKALPKLPANYLTFARSVALLSELIKIPSEGHVQQFLVAAILYHHRTRYGIEIITHHPHASDKFDNTYGDIEEVLEGNLVNAYEVTVRDDWKNRLPDLRAKMSEAGLNKYVLVASNINSDEQLSNPKSLVTFTEKAGFDLAIIDLNDFIRVFCAELKANEIRNALNTCYEYLINPKLCGREDIISAYKSKIDEWVDSK
ncbi:MAG: hypothetical protein KAV87_61215 [Desulfobacteraceae bacterium]|nr:hypothetical protein [Desulfobacteraceae bacterium]